MTYIIKLDQIIYTIDSCYFNYIFLRKYDPIITISSKWGHPNAFSNGFNPQDVVNDLYAHSSHLKFWAWAKHELIKTVTMTLETWFMHNPKLCHIFVNGAISSNIIHCYKNDKTNECDGKYIQVPGVDMEIGYCQQYLD